MSSGNFGTIPSMESSHAELKENTIIVGPSLGSPLLALSALIVFESQSSARPVISRRRRSLPTSLVLGL
jgi:hypothetical protein